jgi:hypothetical protein
MRWTAAGAQNVAQLRALYYSAHARWEGFGATRPLARLQLLPPPAATPATSTAAVPAALAPPDHEPAPPPAPGAPPAAAAQHIATDDSTRSGMIVRQRRADRGGRGGPREAREGATKA